MWKTTIRLAILATSLVVAAGAAHAFQSVPGHADIKVKAKIKTVNGVKTVVGCTVSFCVRKPRGGLAIHQQVTGARPTVWTPAGAKALGENDRAATYEPEQFRGILIGDDVATPDVDTVYPGTLEIDYEKHGVKPGQTLTLITSWRYPGNYHVYGAVTNSNAGNNFTTPEK